METRQEVLKLLKSDYSWDDIKSSLNLTDSDLLLIYYKLINRNEETIPFDIEMKVREDYTSKYLFKQLGGQRVLLISDTHLGSIFENSEYLEQVKDFIKSNKIKVIVNGGDIGDGLVKYQKQLSTYTSQIDHILDFYNDFPQVEQYIIGGNHDRRYKEHDADIIKILDKEFEHIHEVGYYQAYFSLYDKVVSLEHNSHMQQNRLVDPNFTIAGHAHKASFKKDKVLLPTVSDSMPSNNPTAPGFCLLDSKKRKSKVDLLFDYYTFSNNGARKTEEVEYELEPKVYQKNHK